MLKESFERHKEDAQPKEVACGIPPLKSRFEYHQEGHKNHLISLGPSHFISKGLKVVES